MLCQHLRRQCRAKVGVSVAHNRQRQPRRLESTLVAPSCLRPPRRNTSVELNREAAVRVVDHLHLLAHQATGTALGFKIFDKIQTVQPGAIVDNKRLSAVLEQVKAQQAAYPARQQREHVARQRPPNNLEAPGLPSKGRAPRCCRGSGLRHPDGGLIPSVFRYITEIPPAKPATIAPWLGWVFEGSGDLPRCLRRWWLGNHRVAGAGQLPIGSRSIGVSLQPAIPRRVAPQQSPLPLHRSPTM